MSSNHHKKLKTEFPSWLWFPIYQVVEPKHEWTEEKDKIARKIINSLITHLDIHDLANKVITEPNQYDFSGMYSGSNESRKLQEGGKDDSLE